jgi:exodeoxyribonuclease-3
MSKWLENGFTDAFRHKNPELAEYSWWTFRAGARSKNKGWRIDYQSVSDPLKDKIISVNQLTSVTHSDHCPVKMVIDL